jgi:glycogen synthase
MPYRVSLPSGAEMVVFFYNAPISAAVAFEGLLNSGEAFARRLLAGFPNGREGAQLVHIATDGESYGHHHRFGDMALAYALDHLEHDGGAQLTDYGEFLERFPPTHEALLFEHTAWSCAHGLGRWQENCGCHTGGHPDWSQAWRGPLRHALDWLRDELAWRYETAAAPLVDDPWAAREAYVDVVLERSPESVAGYLERQAPRARSRTEQQRLLALLEMQRNAMLMYTSCGWFWDDPSGWETVQILRYAARAVQLARDTTHDDLEPSFRRRLAHAKSNLPAERDGAHIYDLHVRSAMSAAPGGDKMKVLLLTNEYPPYTYGGAGVHVEFLSQELARLMDVEVRCFGDQRIDTDHLRVRGYEVDKAAFTAPSHLRPVFEAMARDVAFGGTNVDADVVHCHTWYTHLGGILIKLAYGIPLVITVHSLEPLRPWKREQLGGGYEASSWVERTALELADAVIAVSGETRADVLRLFDVDPARLHVIHNGIDPALYRPVAATDALDHYGIRQDRPYVLFVGRITRQKGIIHLVRAIPEIDPNAQVVLCAGAPDTPEIGAEMEQAVVEVSARRDGVIWVRKMVPRDAVMQLYTHATVFCCPSIYEPFGLINLEAMACETAVVASAVGGIPEVVVDGQTGLLVPVEQQDVAPFEPVDPAQFSHDLATAINRLLADPPLAERMGKAGRRRVEAHFSWSAVARRTQDLYRSLVAARA